VKQQAPGEYYSCCISLAGIKCHCYEMELKLLYVEVFVFVVRMTEEQCRVDHSRDVGTTSTSTSVPR
jgi:hypothetical protein